MSRVVGDVYKTEVWVGDWWRVFRVCVAVGVDVPLGECAYRLCCCNVAVSVDVRLGECAYRLCCCNIRAAPGGRFSLCVLL